MSKKKDKSNYNVDIAPKKKKSSSIAGIDVSKAHMIAVKNSIRGMKDRDIDDLVKRMERVVSAYDQRQSLIRNVQLVLKIAAIVAAV